MLMAFARDGTDASDEHQLGFHNLTNLKKKCWHAFVKGVEREYGGFEKFATNKLGFSADDLAKIRRNLTSA
jgi:hypothetical protein